MESGLWRYAKKDLISGVEAITRDDMKVSVKGDLMTLGAMAQSIVISDISGRQALRLAATSTADLSGLAPGLYVYEIISDGRRTAGKFVK